MNKSYEPASSHNLRQFKYHSYKSDLQNKKVYLASFSKMVTKKDAVSDVKRLFRVHALFFFMEQKKFE